MVRKEDLDTSKTYWYWDLGLSNKYRAYRQVKVCEVKVTLWAAYTDSIEVRDLNGKLLGDQYNTIGGCYRIYETKEEAIKAWNEFLMLNIKELNEWCESKTEYLKNKMIQNPVKKIKRGTSENP